MPSQDFKVSSDERDLNISYSDACLFSAFRLHMFENKSYEINITEFEVDVYTVQLICDTIADRKGRPKLTKDNIIDCDKAIIKLGLDKKI